MGILGGEGFSLPVITQTEVVDVKITVTENSIKQMKKFPGINIPDVFKVLTKQLNALGLSVSLYGFNFNNFNSKKLTFDMNSKSRVNSSIKYKKQSHRVSFPYSTL